MRHISPQAAAFDRGVARISLRHNKNVPAAGRNVRGHDFGASAAKAASSSFHRAWTASTWAWPVPASRNLAIRRLYKARYAARSLLGAESLRRDPTVRLFALAEEFRTTETVVRLGELDAPDALKTRPCRRRGG